MNGTICGWAAYAAVNVAAGAGIGGLSAAPGPVALSVASVALGTKAALDLKAVYGPLTAAAAPALTTGLGLLGSGHSSAPAAASVALLVLTRSAAHLRGTR